MTDQNNVEKIIALFTKMVNETKADILPILNKESWDEIKEIGYNFRMITEAYNEFGKFLVTAKEMIAGKDETFSKEEEDRLISEVASIVNKEVNIPALPEFIEQKIFNFLLYSGYNLSKEKFKNSPQLQAVYNGFAKELAKR